ncbi:hypothetical protein V8F20_008107 [Naviculisporaceae sp. PSN 640]
MISLYTTVIGLMTAGLTLGLSAPIPGYGVADFVWGVDAYGNGTMINITGPVEHVYEELKKINPTLVKNLHAAEAPSRTTNEIGPTCGALSWGFGQARKSAIDQGVDYLHNVPGVPVLGPGPGKCGRVSCSWKSAIWWCNDKKVEAKLPGFNVIGDCAKVLCDSCQEGTTFTDPYVKCRGQNFNGGDWNCIVRKDEDSC